MTACYPTQLCLTLCFFCLSRKLSTIILKKVGTIGGNEHQVKTRIKQILSRINKSVDFDIAEVRVRGTAFSSRPPIYEVRLEDADSAVALRKSFAQFTRKKDPVRLPPELKGVEVFNSITLATRVRISILRVSFLNLFGVAGSVFWLWCLFFE